MRAFISVLDEIYCAFVVFDDFLRGFAVPNRPLRPLSLAFPPRDLPHSVVTLTMPIHRKIDDLFIVTPYHWQCSLPRAYNIQQRDKTKTRDILHSILLKLFILANNCLKSKGIVASKPNHVPGLLAKIV